MTAARRRTITISIGIAMGVVVGWLVARAMLDTVQQIGLSMGLRIIDDRLAGEQGKGVFKTIGIGDVLFSGIFLRMWAGVIIGGAAGWFATTKALAMRRA